jgi:hypothetical protein
MNIHISRTLKRLETFLKALTEKNAITVANKSLTATKPRYCCFAKVAPLLRLAIGRWGQWWKR